MIIKKKYTNINPQIEEAEIQTVSDSVEPQVNNIKEPVPIEQETLIEQDSNDVQMEDQEILPDEPKGFSLDLSMDDIKFEQRPERREGTRRRGYRRTQDRNIVSRAQREAQTIKEAAKQDGYNEGINQATKDIAELTSKLAEFFGYKEIVFQKVSECILDISVEIAKKIIIKELETDKSALISMIKAAVNEVNKTEEKLTLKVMPKDVEIVRDSISEIFSDGTIQAKIVVVPDNSVKDGGVIIQTSNGIIDATLETQLAIIEKALKVSKTKEEDDNGGTTAAG